MSQVDFGAVQLKEIHLSALDEMGDDGGETLPPPGIFVSGNAAGPSTKGDSGEKDFKKKS